MDFTELDFIEGLFALLEKQGITNFNKEDFKIFPYVKIMEKLEALIDV